MSIINLTESESNKGNLYYLQSTLSELFVNTKCSISEEESYKRIKLTIECPEYYLDIVRAEIIDRVAEIIVIKYKYEFFKRRLGIGGLTSEEKEILITSLIAADLEDDKRYTLDRLKNQEEIAVDGVYNFRLRLLKSKWEDIVSYMPPCFISSQLKDFVTYLLENKKKRVYVDEGKVYDSHYRRLKRCSLLDGEELQIIREVLLSNCGEVEISGTMPNEQEVAQLFVTAAMEMLTNAVRHAEAKKIFMEFEEEKQVYTARFTNDGKIQEKPVSEGCGLGSLRQKTESIGGSMSVEWEKHFALILRIPRER
jgi:hypothetical protein